MVTLDAAGQRGVFAESMMFGLAAARHSDSGEETPRWTNALACSLRQDSVFEYLMAVLGGNAINKRLLYVCVCDVQGVAVARGYEQQTDSMIICSRFFRVIVT